MPCNGSWSAIISNQNRHARLKLGASDEVVFRAKSDTVPDHTWQHRFKQTGHLLSAGFNDTFHREDEKYFFTNYMPTFTGLDSFMKQLPTLFALAFPFPPGRKKKSSWKT